MISLLASIDISIDPDHQVAEMVDSGQVVSSVRVEEVEDTGK
jgi:hypothetical protein